MSDCSDAYFDRNQAVLALFALLKQEQITVGWKDDEEDVNYVILFADLPTGQISYHIPRHEIDLKDWSKYPNHWDLHTTSQKRDRLHAFVTQTLTGD